MPVCGQEVGRDLLDLRHRGLRDLHAAGGLVDVVLPGLQCRDLRFQVERHRGAGAQPGIGVGHQAGADLVGELIEILLDRRAVADQAGHLAVIGGAGGGDAHRRHSLSRFAGASREADRRRVMRAPRCTLTLPSPTAWERRYGQRITAPR